MPLVRLKTFQLAALCLVACGPGCIDFDRVGRSDQTDSSSNTLTGPSEFAQNDDASFTGIFPQHPLTLDDPDDTAIGWITIGWFGGGMLLLLTLSGISYRRNRPTRRRRHRIGSAIRRSPNTPSANDDLLAAPNLPA